MLNGYLALREHVKHYPGTQTETDVVIKGLSKSGTEDQGLRSSDGLYSPREGLAVLHKNGNASIDNLQWFGGVKKEFISYQIYFFIICTLTTFLRLLIYFCIKFKLNSCSNQRVTLGYSQYN